MESFWTTLRPLDGAEDRRGVFALAGEPPVPDAELWTLADPGGRLRASASEADDGVLVERLRAHGASLADEELDRLLRALLHGCFFRLPPIRFEALYRARVVAPAQAAHVSDLWHPPPAKVLAYGRANLPGESVLYASFTRAVALCEVRPRVGEHVAVLRAVPVAEEPQHLFPLGLAGELPPELRERADPMRLDVYVDERDRARIRRVHELFVELFTAEARAGDARGYAPSARLARLVLDAVPGLAGVAYPSAVTRRASIAVALRAHEADRILRPRSCELYRVDGEDAEHFAARHVRTCGAITADGVLRWTDLAE